MGKNRSEDIPCEEVDRYDHLTPRCSTPTFDPCVGSRRTIPARFVVPEGERETEEDEDSAFLNRRRKDRELYEEWKLRLHQGKSRIFRMRGVRNRTPTNDCSIISGHFEKTVIPRPEDEATPKPAPVYQMWFPFGYPGFFTPAYNCQHQNQLWYGTPQLHNPQYHGPSINCQSFTPAQYFFANLCQGCQTAQFVNCEANYHRNIHPQIHQPTNLRYRFFDPQHFQNYSPIPPSYPQPSHYFYPGTNAVAFPLTMAS